LSATVIEVAHLSKRFGKTVAVDDLSFTIAPGTITGMLGPNGAGKTTTLRVILDLVTATSGTTRILGGRYRDLDHPARRVGTLLDAAGFHPGRSGRNALRVVARQSGIAADRVSVALDQVGLTKDGTRRVKGYSTGMKARLALGAALLGDPQVLLLDEPANGLDPEGIAWLRGFLRGLASEGRTVLVSSHVLAEVEQTVDDVLIMHHGRLVAGGNIAELSKGMTARVWVRSPQAGALHELLHRRQIQAWAQDEWLIVQGPTCEDVGRLAFDGGIVLSGLYDEKPTLEQLFFNLTQTQVRPS
jgi:ABC-2 type transport system ATP-binding protein